MVIHDRSYSRWDGDKTGPTRAWSVILDRGVVTGLNSLFKRKLFAVLFILAAYGPFLAVIGVLYVNFFLMTNPEFTEASRQMQEGPMLDALIPRGKSAFLYLFKIQSWFALALCVIIGAGLIAEDRRTNALELYLSRPVLVFDYVVGKLAVLGFFIAMVTVVPALILVLVYMVLNGLESEMVAEQLRLMGRVVLAGSVAGLIPAVLVLTASSLSKRARSAAITFVGFLVLLEGVIGGMLSEGFRDDALKVVSIHFNVSQCVAWLLDSASDLDPTVPLANSVIVLAGWLVLCFAIILRKVRPVEIVA
jgi:ABC-type transport system involved in multi-copper enzyme maturation permease subunit